jgi:hypothetical protein
MRRTSVIRSTSRHRRRSSWHECCGILQSHNLDRPCAHMSSSVRMRFRRGPGSVLHRTTQARHQTAVSQDRDLRSSGGGRSRARSRVEESSRCSRPPLVERERGRHFAMR